MKGMNGRDDRSYPYNRQKPDTSRYIIIPASNEPSGHACMHIWRLPRGSNTPLLAAGSLTERIIEAECMSEGVRISRR